MRRLPAILYWLLIATIVAASGVAYNLLFDNGVRPYVGIVYALLCGLPVILFERNMIFPALRRKMQLLPTPAFIALALVLDFALISIGFAVSGALLKLADIGDGTWREATVLPPKVFIYAVTISTAIAMVQRVRELLGRDVFFSLLTGRYRHPVQEERVFLFVDLVGSTAFAEEFGDLRTQQFLGSLFTAVSAEVIRHRGAIDDYVGDAAIITWPMERGIVDARCVRCAFDIIANIEANSEFWLRTYGRVPRIRAALHGGPIVTAEIGVDHHKITYFGDTINTTARLEALCKTLERPVLISADLASWLTLPEDISAEDLGEHAVKGRGQALGVVSLQRRLVGNSADLHRRLHVAG